MWCFQFLTISQAVVKVDYSQILHVRQWCQESEGKQLSWSMSRLSGSLVWASQAAPWSLVSWELGWESDDKSWCHGAGAWDLGSHLWQATLFRSCLHACVFVCMCIYICWLRVLDTADLRPDVRTRWRPQPVLYVLKRVQLEMWRWLNE